MKKKLSLRIRIDFNQLCSIGPGKIQLLEAIEKTGSLSQAARDMDMSYRRAWLLMDSMNSSFDKTVASASTGGTGGGGAALTEFGQELVKTFRDLEKKLAGIAEKHLRDIEPHVQLSPTKKAKSVKLQRSFDKPKRTRMVRKV
ncbi:MAG TPA: LysR family transcriptional regulator [Steroidobacteraceae bacterium]|nr:LysR family transcriptional regulator [Steroidobacteraceae bacterium]